MNDNPLLTLAGYFALLSLFAVGGANAAIPEMHRIAVETMHPIRLVAGFAGM